MLVGNLPSKKKATVSFSYVIKLKVEVDSSVCFKLPTVLHPRYNPQVEGKRYRNNSNQSKKLTIINKINENIYNRNKLLVSK